MLTIVFETTSLAKTMRSEGTGSDDSLPLHVARGNFGNLNVLCYVSNDAIIQDSENRFEFAAEPTRKRFSHVFDFIPRVLANRIREQIRKKKKKTATIDASDPGREF